MQPLYCLYRSRGKSKLREAESLAQGHTAQIFIKSRLLKPRSSERHSLQEIDSA